VRTAPADDARFRQEYMPDDVTRDLARRMHYAAFRWRSAPSPRQAARWRRRYYGWRDRIVLGNRKLACRAARRAGPDHRQIEDLIADCHVVLIQAVAAYNPWLGVRFSTFAFTCLLRALARQRRRLAEHRPVVSLSHNGEAESAVIDSSTDPADTEHWRPWLRYLRDENALLTPAEKIVLERRYQLDGQPERPTLQSVGQELGLSKERVRQIQISAVDKLRHALRDAAEVGLEFAV
jgi:RNA polymerase sigma factor (sigma-70 family)